MRNSSIDSAPSWEAPRKLLESLFDLQISPSTYMRLIRSKFQLYKFQRCCTDQKTHCLAVKDSLSRFFFSYCFFISRISMCEIIVYPEWRLKPKIAHFSTAVMVILQRIRCSKIAVFLRLLGSPGYSSIWKVLFGNLTFCMIFRLNQRYKKCFHKRLLGLICL